MDQSTAGVAAGPRPAGAILVAINTLSHIVARTEELQKQLRDKLHPVLQETPPSPPSDKEDSPEATCLLDDKINKLIGSLSITNEALTAILNQTQL